MKDFLSRISQRELCFFLVLNAIRSLVWPYGGFVHDARLYALQVMNRVRPGFFDRDIFFSYGSQDSYSIFSMLMAPLTSAVGLQWSFFLVYLASTALLIFAEMRLVRCLIPNRLAGNVALILLAVILLPYGGWSIFHVQETFLTARLPAVALTLLGLEQLLRSRFASALVLMLLAMAVHPLMAVGGLLVAIAATCIAKLPLRVVLPIGLTAVLAAIAVLLYRPLGTLLLGYMDPEWYNIVRQRSPFCYPAAWFPPDWYRIAFSLGLLAVASRYLDRNSATVIRLVILLALACVVGACLGERYPYVLLLQGNPYRGLWLLQLLAVPLGVLTAFRLWEDSISAACLGSAGYARWWRPGVAARLIAIAALVLLMTAFVFPELGLTGFFAMLWLIPKQCDALIMVTTAILFIVCLWLATKDTRKRCLLAAAVWIGVSTATFLIQNDPGFRGAFERDHTKMDFVHRFVHKHWQDRDHPPTVYWPTDAIHVWFDVAANSFYSGVQLAGIIYSRPTAIEGQRRALLVRPFEVDRMRELLQSGRHRNWFLRFYQADMHQPTPTRQDLINLCKEQQLDFVILRQQFDDLAAGTNGRVSIYDCRSIRAKELAGRAGLPKNSTSG